MAEGDDAVGRYDVNYQSRHLLRMKRTPTVRRPASSASCYRGSLFTRIPSRSKATARITG
ncbi:MAG: hypothetical protein A2138_20625 [Deltaproteobacteria bacterium RBG_16_71_12]|nr:MAG: hypothetical protein A2138_20625 [Deltaproteobacteria bacterium RBG_16_71_12]